MPVGDQHSQQPGDVLRLLGEAARRLSEADTFDATLERIVELGEEILANCDGASLMLIRRHEIVTPASSSQVAKDSDQAQFDTGQGPCLEAIKEQRTIVIDDLETEQRWPAYRERALELGVRSMLSYRLFVIGDTMGALDLYSRTPYAFDEHSQIVGEVFATHASVAMKAALTEAGLQEALRSRDVIGQAKGIVMAKRVVTAQMAFDALRTLSQQRNQPLRAIAEHIVETGQVPDESG